MINHKFIYSAGKSPTDSKLFKLSQTSLLILINGNGIASANETTVACNRKFQEF